MTKKKEQGNFTTTYTVTPKETKPKAKAKAKAKIKTEKVVEVINTDVVNENLKLLDKISYLNKRNVSLSADVQSLTESNRNLNKELLEARANVANAKNLLLREIDLHSNSRNKITYLKNRGLIDRIMNKYNFIKE